MGPLAASLLYQQSKTSRMIIMFVFSISAGPINKTFKQIICYGSEGWVVVIDFSICLICLRGKTNVRKLLVRFLWGSSIFQLSFENNGSPVEVDKSKTVAQMLEGHVTPRQMSARSESFVLGFLKQH